jgi:16S rRNA A1518/A1519 N6-dimethyltransferase RsmA/KsgA/DIM1 with predicted DNA glycosylase/AP lyase activity
VIDVRTGQWSMFSPEPSVDSALSAALIRAQSDQHQVALVKEKVYRAAVEAFVARYAS